MSHTCSVAHKFCFISSFFWKFSTKKPSWLSVCRNNFCVQFLVLWTFETLTFSSEWNLPTTFRTGICLEEEGEEWEREREREVGRGFLKATPKATAHWAPRRRRHLREHARLSPSDQAYCYWEITTERRQERWWWRRRRRRRGCDVAVVVSVFCFSHHTHKQASFSPHSLLTPCTKRVTLFVDKERQNGEIDKTQPPFIALLPRNHFAWFIHTHTQHLHSFVVVSIFDAKSQWQ